MKLQNSKAMRKNLGRNIVAAAAALMVVESSGAFTFEWGEVKGSFDSSVSLGAGARTESPSASYVSPVYDLGGGGGISGGGNMGQFSGITDQGDINYRRGDLFTGYLKGSHELLLKMPSENLTFMARVNWLRDFVAGHVTGDLSGQDQVASMVGTAPSLRDGLPSEARTDLAFKARLLDLWVSKSFYIGENRARVRFGNQVINWGESIYEIGGINSTNAVDANKAAQDRERLINEGMAYANDVIPKARGAAARLMQEAEGYRQSTIATAEGDASRFKQVLVEYSKAPQVTRDRMYLEVMQQVFANNAKVFVDSKAGGNLLYLPLDKLIQQSGTDSSTGTANKPTNGELSSQSPAPAVPRVGSEESRGRGAARMRERESGR